MFSLIFTFYCICCVIFGAVLISYSCVHNVLPRAIYKWMLVFFPATMVIGFLGMVWFTAAYYVTGKSED